MLLKRDCHKLNNSDKIQNTRYWKFKSTGLSNGDLTECSCLALPYSFEPDWNGIWIQLIKYAIHFCPWYRIFLRIAMSNELVPPNIPLVHFSCTLCNGVKKKNHWWTNHLTVDETDKWVKILLHSESMFYLKRLPCTHQLYSFQQVSCSFARIDFQNIE